MSKKILVTGSAGFYSGHFIEHCLKNTDWEIYGVDRLDPEAANLDRVGEILEAHPEYRNRFKFYWWNLASPLPSNITKQWGKINQVYHLCSSSHVDFSISDPLTFCYDNVVSTVNTLNYCRELDSLDFIHIMGTDEIKGNAPEGVSYKESDSLDRPRNPYAAFKCAADHISYAFHITYGLPVVISNCVNLIGEKQQKVKYLPLVIDKVLKGEELLVHAYPGCTKAGSRCYVHCRSTAAAALFLSEKGVRGERYNISGQVELDNLTFAKMIAEIIGKPLHYKLVDFHSSRPAHDTRYSLDGTKLKELGFNYPMSFEESLVKCVNWYLDNPKWLI